MFLPLARSASELGRIYSYPVVLSSFPGGSASEEPTCHAGDLGVIPGLGWFPGGGHGNPLQYSWLENPHGQRSLAGYNPWGSKESDMTKWLNTAQHSGSIIVKRFFPFVLTPNFSRQFCFHSWTSVSGFYKLALGLLSTSFFFSAE